MLELDMLRKINIFVFCIFLNASLSAKEPMLARFEYLVSNNIQVFAIKNYMFECKAYGILSLEDLYRKSKQNSLCKKSIENFYIDNPISKEYIQRVLKYKQLYHFETKNNQCIVYAKGEVSISEKLLRNGVAVLKPSCKAEEFEWSFISAQRKAKMQKKGLWGENIFNDCIDVLYK
jgi:hypothetical protein